MSSSRYTRALLMGAITLGAAVLPTLAAAGQLGAAAAFEPPLLRLVLGLILCSFIALIAALALRRFMRKGWALPGTGGARAWFAASGRQVIVHETQRVSLHGDICRVGWRGRDYLIVVSQNGVAVLAEKDSLPADAAAAP
jgi:membrane protein implicated in regulation of membrane protease activity